MLTSPHLNYACAIVTFHLIRSACKCLEEWGHYLLRTSNPLEALLIISSSPSLITISSSWTVLHYFLILKTESSLYNLPSPQMCCTIIRNPAGMFARWPHYAVHQQQWPWFMLRQGYYPTGLSSELCTGLCLTVLIWTSVLCVKWNIMWYLYIGYSRIAAIHKL